MVGFFCGPWKEAIIVEKYLPNVCSDLSFHNHINYQRNPVVFIHVFIYHIHSSLFVSWFFLKNLITLKLWIYTVGSEMPDIDNICHEFIPLQKKNPPIRLSKVSMYVDIHYKLTKQVRQVTVILYYSSHYLLLNLIPFFFLLMKIMNTFH